MNDDGDAFDDSFDDCPTYYGTSTQGEQGCADSDGDTWSDSFTVQCDKENNPEADIRAGMLTVDVQVRPVFPAEFVRIRFSQTPMQVG